MLHHQHQQHHHRLLRSIMLLVYCTTILIAISINPNDNVVVMVQSFKMTSSATTKAIATTATAITTNSNYVVPILHNTYRNEHQYRAIHRGGVQQHHHHNRQSSVTALSSSSSSSSLSSSSSSAMDSPTPTTTTTIKKVLFVDWMTSDTTRLSRSVCACIGCIVSWMIANTTPYTIVQAASITGIVATVSSAIITKVSKSSKNMYIPYTIATFCGALAGMSGNILLSSGSSIQSLSISSAISLLYYPICVGYAFGLWDQQKWGVGIGGRLGTIAFGGNVLYSSTMLFIFQKILSILKSTTVTSTTTAATTVFASFVPDIVKRLYSSSLPICTSLILSTILLQQSRKKAKDVAVSDTSAITDIQQEQSIYKSLLFSTLAIPILMQQYNSGTIISFMKDYIGTVLSVFIGSQIVKKNMSNTTFGPIHATALVGWIGSLLFAPSSILSRSILSITGSSSNTMIITPPKLFLGALMGLTSLPNFTIKHFISSSLMASLLFHLQFLDGFGGKLGCLAYMGILFGM